MAFDDIFNYIGGIGAYQITLFLLLGVTCTYSGLHGLAMIFLVPNQDHWCRVDQLTSLPYDQQKYIAIPYNEEDGIYESCYYYDIDYDSYTVEEFCNWDWGQDNTSRAVIKCDQWVYDTTQYAKTGVSEFDLVCDRAYFVGLTYSTSLLGILIASLFGSIASDYYGRKPIITISFYFAFIFSFLSAFSPNYATFIVFRFMIAIFVTLTTNISSVYINEFVGAKYREITGTMYWCFYALGFMILPCIAYFVTDFEYIQIVMACFMIPSLFYILIISESPRWLVMNDKTEQATQILSFMADVNNKSLPKDTYHIISSEEERDDHEDTKEKQDIESPGILKTLFLNKTIRKALLLNFPAYIACSMVYNGLSYNVEDLSGNIYLNAFISGTVELPANVFSLFLLHFFGRKKTLMWTLICSGSFLLLCVPFVSSEGSTVVTSLAMIGKFFISASYAMVGLYTTEMFPTNVRNTAMGMCVIVSSLAGMITPFMGAPLMAVWTPLPLLIFGLIGVLTGPVTILLPETSNISLPNTVEDAENLWLKRNHIVPQPETPLGSDEHVTQL